MGLLYDYVMKKELEQHAKGSGVDQDPVIKEAMKKVSKVSFELGNLIDEDNLSEE